MPLSRLVVPMVVVLALILFIITLVVGVVDEVLLKLQLLLDKTLLLLWCAADDDWPLASVGFDTRLRSGWGKFCPLLSTTDGGGLGDNIGDSCTMMLK
jgi:hypothetical protein